MADTTIPKQLYVTIQYRKDANNEDGHLGFASPYTKDAAFKKRKSTQDGWAYGYGATVTIAEDDSITVENGGTRGGLGGGEKWDSAMLFITNCYPKILNNDLVEGFEIAKSVRRYGWNGSGNVKWRITDPRGFDLEISSENFASMIDCSTIENGVIKGKCCWGRQGANNILLPESSEPYKAASATTQKINNKLSLKDVSIGDEVELLNGDYKNEKLTYLGAYKVIEAVAHYNTATGRYASYGDQQGLAFNKTQKDRYFFKRPNGEYYAQASPKIGSVTSWAVPEAHATLTREDIAAKINAHLKKSSKGIYGCNMPIFVSVTKVDLADIAVDLKENDFKFDGTFPAKDGSNYRCRPLFVRQDDELWMSNIVSGGYQKAGTAGTYNIVRMSLTDGILRRGIEQIRDKWGSVHGRYIERAVPTDAQWLDLVVIYKDAVYPITTLGYL